MSADNYNETVTVKLPANLYDVEFGWFVKTRTEEDLKAVRTMVRMFEDTSIIAQGDTFYEKPIYTYCVDGTFFMSNTLPENDALYKTRTQIPLGWLGQILRKGLSSSLGNLWSSTSKDVKAIHTAWPVSADPFPSNFKFCTYNKELALKVKRDLSDRFLTPKFCIGESTDRLGTAFIISCTNEEVVDYTDSGAVLRQAQAEVTLDHVNLICEENEPRPKLDYDADEEELYENNDRAIQASDHVEPFNGIKDRGFNVRMARYNELEVSLREAQRQLSYFDDLPNLEEVHDGLSVRINFSVLEKSNDESASINHHSGDKFEDIDTAIGLKMLSEFKVLLTIRKDMIVAEMAHISES